MALVDIFLKIDGVEGESQDTSHKNEIQLDGFRQAVRSPRDAATGQASGRRAYTHFTCFAKVDLSTAKLFDKIAHNAKIPKAILVCRKAGKDQHEYFKVTLLDCYIVRVDIHRPPEGRDTAIPSCEFDIEFGQIQWESKQQDTTSGITSGPVMSMDDLRTSG